MTESDLTDDDIRLILELLEKSDFDYLDIRHGPLRLKASKVPLLGSSDADQVPESASTDVGTVGRRATEAESVAETAHLESVTLPEDAQVASTGHIPIVAPSVGIFYSRPEPGAPPFVQAGSVVDSETTVCLLEVMKLFNSVLAGRSGTIAATLAVDGDFVEYGQPLFLLDVTDGPSSA